MFLSFKARSPLSKDRSLPLKYVFNYFSDAHTGIQAAVRKEWLGADAARRSGRQTFLTSLAEAKKGGQGLS
jgi:hypothetical protein